MKVFLLVLYLAWLYTTKSWPEYHQDDYDLKFEKILLTWYNHSYARDLKWHIGWYNRTTRAVNASGYLLQDIGLSDGDIVSEVEFHRFASNEYRAFPMRISINVCQEYRRNTMKCQDQLKGMSNIHNCPLKKGYYWIRSNGVMPDYSLLPPFMVRGQFKNHLKLFSKGALLAEIDTYFSVVDKPLKWDQRN